MIVQSLNSVVRRVPVWVVYILLPVPGVVTFCLGLTGGLGAEPIKALEQELGEFSLNLLVLGLSISPILRFTGLNLLRFRRAIGVMAFTYVTTHFLTWLILDLQSVNQIFADIKKRPYVTVGFLGFLLLVPLALTSNNWAVRSLGRFWPKLHSLVYVAAILGSLHYIMLTKGFQLEPLIYMAVIISFIAARMPKWWRSWARK
jgi:sulfoxide reductase heme-binding subunit YedZ